MQEGSSKLIEDHSTLGHCQNLELGPHQNIHHGVNQTGKDSRPRPQLFGAEPHPAAENAANNIPEKGGKFTKNVGSTIDQRSLLFYVGASHPDKPSEPCTTTV